MTYTPKNQSPLRSASQPSSPAPPSPNASAVVTERARPLARVPFNLRRTSLTLAGSPSPASSIQDNSYLEALGLRLNEAVSRSLAQPSGPSLPGEQLGGRRPIPAGRGRTLGMLITSELQTARDNKSLHRAVLRALHKPLSVLLSDLSALLSPLLSSPAFRSSVSNPGVPIPNTTQLHALAISDFAGELLSTFDDMALGLDTDTRSDGLRPVRVELISLIGRVTTPLITGFKEELVPLVDALETPSKTTTHKVKGSVHPSIIALQSLVTTYTRVLARFANTQPSDTLLASFLISVVWQVLVALSHRLVPVQGSLQVVFAEKGQHTSSLGVPPVVSTGLFNFKRGPSRPTSPSTVSTVVADAKALYKIFSHLPRPHTQVAREAVDEAFVQLEALVSLLEAVGNPLFEANKTMEEIASEIHDLTDELPTLIALPVLLQMRFFEGILEPELRMVAALCNIPEVVYRREYLAGFGLAEQYGPVVAQRILDEISSRPTTDHSECLVDWLEGRLCPTSQ